MNRRLAAALLLVSLMSIAANAFAQVSNPDRLTCKGIFGLESNQEFLRKHQEAFFSDFRRLRPTTFLRNTVAYRDIDLLSFVNVQRSGTARLEGTFLATFRPLTGDVYDVNQVSTGTVYPLYRYDIFRGTMATATGIPVGTTISQYARDTGPNALVSKTTSPTSQVLGGIVKALNQLYSSFAEQGPERKILVDILPRQDRQEADRAVHFFVEHLGHAQILVSKGPHEPLHIESQWPEIGLIPGKKRGELGRLSLFNESQHYFNGFLNLRYDVFGREAKVMARLILFQKMVSWANHDAALDTLSLQINSGVKRVLEIIGVPLNLATQKEVSRSYEGKTVKEHILIFDKAGLQKAEDVLLARINAMILERALKKPEHEFGKVILRFGRNELRALISSGLFGIESPRLLAEISGVPENQTSEYAHVFSRDFSDSAAMNADGRLRDHVMMPVEQNRSAPGPFPAIDQLLGRVDFSNGVLKSPNFNLVSVRYLDVHLSRAAAIEALRLLTSPR